MMPPSPLVLLNGTVLPAAEARIDPTDRGFTLGDGLFETLAVRGGQVLRAEAHMARLHHGCAVLGLPRPVGVEEAVERLIAANGLGDGMVRLTYTRGPAPRGVVPPRTPQPTLLLTASAGQGGALAPAVVIVAGRTRRNEHSPLSRCKTLAYLDNILAAEEAREAGADDALLLNTAGRVAESTVANVFIRRRGVWLTPPLADGCLPGTVRGAILAAGGAEEGTFSPADLGEAEAAFLTSAAGLRPVAVLAGRPLESLPESTLFSG